MYACFESQCDTSSCTCTEGLEAIGPAARTLAGRGHLRIVKTLELGQGFGELALQVAGGTRAATVRASEWSEFLIINGFIYRKVLAKYHREDMNNRVRPLCHVEHSWTRFGCDMHVF